MRDTNYNYKFYSVKIHDLPVDTSNPNFFREKYVVVNNETGVIEFDHEVLPFVLEWISHFETRLQDIKDGKSATTDEVASIVQSIN